MKLPAPPPDVSALLPTLFGNPQRLLALLPNARMTDAKGRYLHWDKLRFLQPPENVTPEEWWVLTKLARQQGFRELPLLDVAGRPFVLALPDDLMAALHWLDQNASGVLAGEHPVANPRNRNQYLFHSLVEEAIHSSQIEGASTTRVVAREMLKTGRSPRDHSEQMIYNNFRAMQFISEMKHEALTPAMVQEIHRIVTHDTLEEAGQAGHLRQRDDVRVVDNRDGTVLHQPPASATLPQRLADLCEFANTAYSNPFLHPVLQAILLHFMIGYDHPFIDGNGRTGRALFYWAMLKNGYWLTEFVAISRVILQAPIQYGKAYLYTESDDNDTTYFLLHQLGVLRQAFDELHLYLKRKEEEAEEAKALMAAGSLFDRLNHRQQALLREALKQPDQTFRVDVHQRTHRTSYQTARTDLLELEGLGLLRKEKLGKAFVFQPAADLRALLKVGKP